MVKVKTIVFEVLCAGQSIGVKESGCGWDIVYVL
jgi:hypothetical protein